MIKVNLAKRSGGGGGGKKGLGGFSFPSSGVGLDGGGDDLAALGAENSNRQLIINLAVILMGCAGLFAYEKTNVPPLRSQAISLKKQLEEKKKKNQGAEQVVAEIARFEKEQATLQGQINAIETIKRDRLREVRVLDYIQREIPEKVWLQKLDLQDGRLSISGFATADSELTTFMDGLQRSAYLKEVLLVRSTEAVIPDMGTVKRFEISCNLDRTL